MSKTFHKCEENIVLPLSISKTLKEIEVGEHKRVSESLQFLVELFHGEFGGKITNYKESRLMAKIIKIEDSLIK